MLAFASALILSQAVLPYRWVYVQTNLQAEDQANRVIALAHRAKRAGYNGLVLADGKMQRLGTVPDYYFKNARRVMDACKSEGLDLIPCVFPVGYAESMLFNDPNLAEGQPVRGAVFTVRGREAQVEPREFFRNGGMEDADGSRLRGMGFQDAIGTSSLIDAQIKHGGSQSLRLEKMTPGANCRIEQEIAVAPHRQYHLSAWVKTEGVDRGGNFAMRALDSQSRGLTTQEVHLKPTQDWTQLHVTFNSGDSAVARIYIGLWDGSKGTIWLDDVSVQEVGLLNVLRRPSCPVIVRLETGEKLAEGTDYERIVDPRMGNVPWPGAFEVWHQPPPIRLVDRRLRDGQRLLVDFDHALIAADNQVAICMSDPKTNEIEQDEARRVEALFHPRGFFMSHDEIRAGNWDSACQARGIDAGPLLAENARKSFDAVQKARPGAEVYVWQDMFDPFHNAHKDYYNFRGDLTGSWKGVPTSVIMVNWYFSVRKQNVPFFANAGYRQILAGYYDHDPGEIRTWLNDAKPYRGIVGVMYTTWVGNYNDLEKFAAAAGFLPK